MRILVRRRPERSKPAIRARNALVFELLEASTLCVNQTQMYLQHQVKMICAPAAFS